MKIGIYGGSFNPIHNGHIALARQMLRNLPLDEVWMMVSPQNPLKQSDSDLLDDRKRWEMTEAALRDEEKLKACALEFNLPKPSYTWRTLQALSNEHPDDRFTLIIGADNWQLFPRWYHSDDILRHYSIAIYPRTGFPVSVADLPEGVTLVNTELYDISSTDIRRRIRQGRPYEHLIPKAIHRLAQKYYGA